VIGAELLNTAIEQAVDICLPHPDPRAKRAKDTAAGAVLIVASAAAIAGLIIFAPKVWHMFF
jgi:undecaprenol kinase